MAPYFDQEDLAGLRALVEAALKDLPAATPDRKRLILRGIIALPIPEAEDASRCVAALDEAERLQLQLFQRFVA